MKHYYRVTPNYLGHIHRFLPNGYYETADENGLIFTDIDTFQRVGWHKEVCFGKNFAACFFSMGKKLKPGTFYLYQTTETPDVFLNKKENPQDYQITEEVRYRRPIEAELIGSINITKEMNDNFTSLWFELDGSEKRLEMVNSKIEKINQNIISTLAPSETIPHPIKDKIKKLYRTGETIKLHDGNYDAVVKEVHTLPSGVDYLIEETFDHERFWISADSALIYREK